MSLHLFRQEAVAHQNERLWGDCTALNPVSLCVITWLLLALSVTVAVLLVTGNYQRKSVVAGVLVADRGTVLVRAPAEGILEEITAGIGERVGKGDRLLRVSTSLSENDGEAVADRLLAENQRQETLLHNLIREKQAEFPVRHAQLDAEMAGARDRLQRLELLAANESGVQSLMEKQYRRLQSLHSRSLASASSLEQAGMELQKQKTVVMQTQLELAETRRMLDKSGRDKKLLALEHQRGLGELQQNLSELHKQNVRLQADQAMDIVSPVTGTLSVLLVGTGQSVMARQALLSLVPEDSVLEAELQVPSRAIGFLREGQTVNLRFDAFPYQKFGIQVARVREISRTVVVPADNGGSGEAYYRVKAILDHQTLRAWDQEHALRPGMQFRADIVLEKRSLLEWLLEPLLINGRL